MANMANMFALLDEDAPKAAPAKENKPAAAAAPAKKAPAKTGDKPGESTFYRTTRSPLCSPSKPGSVRVGRPRRRRGFPASSAPGCDFFLREITLAAAEKSPGDRRKTLTPVPSLMNPSPPLRSSPQPATATTATPSALPAPLASSRAPSRAPRAAAAVPATPIAASPRTARAVVATVLTAPAVGESPPDPRPKFRFRWRADPGASSPDPSAPRIPPRAVEGDPARRFPRRRALRDEKKQRCWRFSRSGGLVSAFDPTPREPSSPRHASLAVPLERTPHLNPTHADFQSVPASVPPTFAATRAPTAAAPARAAGASPATSSTPPRRATTPSPSPSPRSPTTR